MNEGEPAKALTPAMLAARWQCSERHIRNLVDRGEIPSFRLGGKLIRIKITDIEDFENRGGTRCI